MIMLVKDVMTYFMVSGVMCIRTARQCSHFSHWFSVGNVWCIPPGWCHALLSPWHGGQFSILVPSTYTACYI